MKRYVLIFGLLASVIVCTMMIYSVAKCYSDPNFEGNVIVGYTSMVVAFAFMFVAIKNYRDKENGGYISFWQAFRMGLYIVLFASTVYVAVWLIYFYNFAPNFMDVYIEHMLTAAKEKGATSAELQKQVEEVQGYRAMYKTPFGVILLTYMEILPVGIIVALIAALVLKKKPPVVTAA